MANYQCRKEHLIQLSEKRKRGIISFVTSHKKPEGLFATQIAQDTLPIFYEILKDGKLKNKLDLFINSSGGQIDTPWPLINLIREYCDNLHVLIPWKSHSAATLITLGANIIEMGPLASLSPIDPQFQIKTGQKEEVIGASVEDIYGFYSLVKETLELDSQGRAEALKVLSNRITPEILGKMSRTRKEIRVIATNLLKLHLDNNSIIDKIVSYLVEELPSHQYFINRREAKDMGLPVKYLEKDDEQISYAILSSYKDEARMDEPGISIKFGPNETKKEIELSRAFIETSDMSFAFISRYAFHSDGKVEKVGDQWKRVE